MIGPKITTVFRSRWHALFWSAGILATAYCSVPSENDADVSGPTQLAPPLQKHVNPWAKDAK